jgi:hypothetical protein
VSAYPILAVALSGPRTGFVIAALAPEGQEELAPSAQTRSGLTLVVGSVYRTSRDDEAREEWRAWLWPKASGALAVTQSCAVVDAADPRALEGKLRKRCDKDGPWWRAGDGP